MPQSLYLHQTIVYQPEDNTVIIDDILYGKVTVTEQLLIDLLRSPAIQRLHKVLQHGITALVGYTVPVTRFEHSVGAMLLVRYLGASLEEQASALLHDVSHTALSHVMDHAFPGQGSYHEVHKDRYLQTTTIPRILSDHGFDWRHTTREEAFPLLERDSPHLCADRLDYGLRDSIAFGTITPTDARRVIADLVAFPTPHHPQRHIAMYTPATAVLLARAYMKSDATVWSNPEHITLYQMAGDVIALAIKEGVLDEDHLWNTDKVFWQSLKDKGNRQLVAKVQKIEDPSIGIVRVDKDGTYALKLKVRTIDPDVVVDDRLQPVSSVVPAYGDERAKYISEKGRIANMRVI